MNIDDCRVPFKNEHDIQTAKAITNFTESSDHSRGFGNGTNIYEDGNASLEQAKCCIKDSGRFPPIIKYCPKVAPYERQPSNGESPIMLQLLVKN